MINVFKKRTRLYALTTSAFFLLQGVGVSMAVSGVGGTIDSSLTPVGSPQSSCDSNYDSNTDAGSAGAQDSSIKRSPIHCDNKTFTMQGGQITITTSGDNGVSATGSKARVKIHNASIQGLENEQEYDDEDKEEGVGDAVYAVDGASVELVNSRIHSFITGLEADRGAVINMKDGDITEASIGVWADNNSSVFLGDTDVAVNTTALYGMAGAGVTMKSKTLTFPRGYAGVVSESAASVKLDSVEVTIKEAEEADDEDDEGYVTSVFTSHDGFVAFNHGKLSVLNVVGFWIGDSPMVEANESLSKKISNEYLLQNVLNIPIDSSGYDLYTMEEIAETRNAHSEVYGAHDAYDEATNKFITTMGHIVGHENVGTFRVVAGIKSSTIEVKGSDGVGIDFEKGDTKVVADQSSDAKDRGRVVVLDNASFKVPEGVAIEDRGLKGSVFLTGKSEISGDLLLKATSSAHLSVFAHDSVIAGDVSIKDQAHAKFFLSKDSEWRLTKSKKSERKDGCVDVCISSLDLKNSTLKFISSANDSGNYRTLRIGDGEGVVYNADNAWIHFNVRLGEKYASGNSSQVSDRLLIHGNVSGKTILHINAVPGNTVSENTGSESVGDKGAPSSVSLIQVYGKAQEDSFQLNGEYVTLDGYPYQYTLHVYGPNASKTVKYFDTQLQNQLQRENSEFWDFRLENADFVASYLYGYPYRSIVMYSSPPQREETRVITVKDGEDDASFNSVVEAAGEESEETESVNAALPVGRILQVTPESSTETLSSVKSTVGSSNSNNSNLESELPSIPSTPTVSEGDASTDQEGVEGTSEAVTSVPSPTTSPVASTVSERRESTDQASARTSEVVSTPSPTTSPVASTVSEGGASTNPRGTGESQHSVYTVSSNSSLSSRGRSSLNLMPSGADSVARSDRGRISVISTDGISVSSVHTISNKIPSIKSAASIKPSSEVSVTPVASSSLNSTASIKPSSEISVKSVVSSSLNSTASIKPSSEISVTPVASSSGAVGRVLLLNNSGKETVSSTCDATQDNGKKGAQTPYSCSDGKSHTVTNLTLKAKNKTQHSMHAQNENTVIKLENATIMGGNDNESNVDLTKLQAVSAVLAEDNAKVVLEKNSTITSSVIGLEAQNGGKVMMTGGSVNAHYVGALAGSGSSVNLKDTRINVTGDLAVAGLVSQAGKVSMDSGAITLEKGVAVRSEAGGSVELDKVNITAKKGQGKLDSADNFGRAALLLSDNASVDFKNGSIVTDAHALWIMKSDDKVVETGSSRRRRSSEVRPTMNHANIESSTVRVEGDGVYGIYFDGLIQKEASQQNRSKDLETEKAIVAKRSAVSKQEKTPIGITGTVSLKKTGFEVANGIAIYGNNSGGHVSLENKTTLAGDLLLRAENGSNISVSVDSSIAKGDVRVDKSSYAKLDLANSSQWILKRSTQKNLGTSDLGCVDSCISSVSLVNSAINFAPSESEGKYQTLHIGNGKGTVYAAQGDAVIHLNARLNPRDPSDQQVTDRLVIHGDVSGKTKIHVRGDAGNVGDGKANAKIAHSVSIIQVYGQAKKDSFQLDGNYVALRNSPYKYTLRAYAPEATSKQEHVQQKFVKDGGEFWNFRLENQYVKSVGSAALPEQFVRSVVPQVPTYLSLPNSVFHAGLMDISNQNKQLETLRMTSTGMVEVRENPALYLRGYGGSYRYASDLSALEYGYDGDLSYNGVEAGVLLQTIENTDSAISFGVMGTYGKLSLQPLNVEQSQKSAFDKWTATVYGSMQHNVGFYVDGLLSYGLFKGDVLTLARGKTATLKGNPLSVSLAGGQTIMTGYKGVVFDPQVQVVYQHLQFNKARDIDNFDIEMGNLNQWVARVGGRLTKIPTGSEGVNAIAFYGKLYLAHGFEGKQSVHFNDAFKLGAFGSSLEAGLGFNAKLLPQFSLHADILYQHKLNKAGFSGTSFSGGVRYQF
ncbi:autotransporter outer membrane beta-barrel domain-containing protein [Bartonella sp. TT110JLCBS]|uniref:autotransporter outer membrane beta-barrel domain-containing protein n=1 Tax=Bartonella sp. TT110JLCBS TaxID=3243578 RepID=UPI0035CEA0F1